MKIDLDKLVRKNIRELVPYTSARDEYAYGDKIMLDANENPFDLQSENLNRYPDPYQKAVKKKLSLLKGIPTENIFLGNGSDEAIDLAFRIFCNPGEDSAIITPPTYGMYAVSAQINDVEVVSVPLSEKFDLRVDEILDATTEVTKLLFLCSPNNPTANSFTRSGIEKLIGSFPGIVILDEAYIDFSTSEGFLPELLRFPNLIILQTFSKAWARAGMRLGIAYAQPGIISYFNRVKPPYNVNELTQKMAMKSLEQYEKIGDIRDQIIAERNKLMDIINDLKFIKEIYPSDSNFFLLQTTNAKKLYLYLLERNLVVRDRSNQPGCAECLRITVGSPEENQSLVTALKEYESIETSITD